MITFVVYCWVCLLIVCCHTAKIESEENDYNNDSPDTLPKLVFQKYKMGANVVIKCNDMDDKDNITITWEFKHCDGNPHSFHCDNKKMYELDYSEGQWKKLDFNLNQKELQITNTTEEHNGLYRCLHNDSIIKIYRLDIVVPAKRRPKPKILSLAGPNNTTIVPNMPLVIQCKVESEIKPEIRWFKVCKTMKCENSSRISYEGNCYCGLQNFNYAIPVNETVYVSKLSFDAARDVDSGTYVCVAMNGSGENHKNVTIKVGELYGGEESSNSFSLLFLIPFLFVLVPIIIWFVFYKKKTKKRRQQSKEHQKQLIIPVEV